MQGTFLNPEEYGYADSSLLGERSPRMLHQRRDAQRPPRPAGGDASEAGPSAEAASGAGPAGAECAGFSFFDCCATRAWDDCARVRDACGGEGV
jgi:hypothetical protein